MPTYSVRTLHLPQSTGFAAGMVGGLMIMCCSPIVGRLADVGTARVPVRIGAGHLRTRVADVRVDQPCARVHVADRVPGRVRRADRDLHGPILAAFAELFPTKVLSTGLSVAYNFAVTIFGGFAPFLITWLIARTGSNMAPAFYVTLAAAVSFVGTRFVKDAKRGASVNR